MPNATVVDIAIKKGISRMDITAPEPSKPIPVVANKEQPLASTVSVTIAGAGGAGSNFARPFKSDPRATNVLFFDTSIANSRPGETVKILANGFGSGSLRAENAVEIQRNISSLSDEELGVSDVAIIPFSLGGGSGSVISPLLIREYARRGVRPIAVVVADTSHAVGANNTLNTLKTLNAIALNNEIVIPTILLTNDNVKRRGDVDSIGMTLISVLLSLLVTPTYEVDRNDRLNWINSSKVAGSSFGVKILSMDTPGLNIDTNIVLGTKSEDMVDSLLVLLETPDDDLIVQLPPARLKKTGFYSEKHPQIIGRISSDISSIEDIIDHVEKMKNLSKAHTHKSVDRLASNSSDDLIL